MIDEPGAGRNLAGVSRRSAELRALGGTPFGRGRGWPAVEGSPPEAYRRFLLANNGGVPDLDVVDVPGFASSCSVSG